MQVAGVSTFSVTVTPARHQADCASTRSIRFDALIR